MLSIALAPTLLAGGGGGDDDNGLSPDDGDGDAADDDDAHAWPAWARPLLGALFLFGLSGGMFASLATATARCHTRGAFDCQLLVVVKRRYSYHQMTWCRPSGNRDDGRPHGQ